MLFLRKKQADEEVNVMVSPFISLIKVDEKSYMDTGGHILIS